MSFLSIQLLSFTLLLFTSRFGTGIVPVTTEGPKTNTETISKEEGIKPIETKEFTSLPYQLPAESYKSLRALDNSQLDQDLAAKLNANPAWKSLIANKKMSVGIVDISDPYNIRFGSVNGDEMMYAASLPKIAVLLTTMDAFEKNEIKETPELVADLTNMISHSNNVSASRFINLVGFNKIEKVLTDPKYMLYDKDHGGGLWVGKCYAGSSNGRNPDPMKGLSHAATAEEVCNFYYMMAMGKLVSPERSAEMLSIMDNPALHHKFVNTLDRIAPGATVYRKSGTWQNYHSDSVMVWGEGRKYILVALIEDPAGESIIRNLVQPVESVLKINQNSGT